MESLDILVPLSVAIVYLTGVIFWHALRRGQFDDLDRPAHSILDNDDFPV